LFLYFLNTNISKALVSLKDEIKKARGISPFKLSYEKNIQNKLKKSIYCLH
jgi:hypothetical protein